MAAITSWARLEPQTRRQDVGEGISARFYDPLWVLGRQWQTGEFRGEDGGSPVSVRIRHSASPMSRFKPGAPDGGGAVERYDAATAPLEALVEREAPAESGLTPRQAAEAGQQLLRMLTAAGLGRLGPAILAAAPLQANLDDPALDAVSRRFLAVMAGRAPDGALLLARVTGGRQLPGVPATDRAAAAAVVRAWVGWCGAAVGTAPAAGESWQRERLEYRFSVGVAESSGEAVYEAEEYQGGHLDWYAFDRRGKAALGAKAQDGGPRRRDAVSDVVPAPVDFAGMPALRWWELEDDNADFAGAAAGPEDLLRLLLVEFAVNYGNDWFLAPLPAPVGGTLRIGSLIVTNCFGEKTLIPFSGDQRIGGAAWGWFTVSGDAPGLLLVPSLPQGLEGRPLERLDLGRDEMANLAWAVLDTVEGPAGLRIDRAETAMAEVAETSPEGLWGAALRYRLATSVPSNWLPLVPLRGRDGARGFHQAEIGEGLLRGDGAGPRGRLMAEIAAVTLAEEELPRGGVTLTRSLQYARWSDGSSHAWVGRRKRPGRGERASGLAFDRTEPTGES